MTNADLTEMEWLSATLRATAERLERATALLRAAGDLERLQSRLNAIAAERPSVDQVRPGATSPAVAGLATAIAAVREFGSPPMPVGASRAGAVFDHDTDRGGKFVKKSAGGTRPPF